MTTLTLTPPPADVPVAHTDDPAPSDVELEARGQTCLVLA